MFKRVDRRRKRREIEEGLGLDDDEREVFGLHDTDSSESDSDASESASSSATSSDVHHTQPKNKRKRGASPTFNGESDENESNEPTTDDEEDKNEGSGHGISLGLTIASALKEPVRLIRPDPEAWVCTFCPGKVLKHAAMVKVHEASRIHRTRIKRIQEIAMEFSPDEDIGSVLAKLGTEAQPKADGSTLSRRAEIRKAKQAKLKERRKKMKERKAIAKAKKATKTADADDMAGHISDREEVTQASKRFKVEPNGITPSRNKNLRCTSFRAETRTIRSKTSRKNKGITNRAKGSQINGTTPA